MGGHLLAPVDRIRMALQVVEMIRLVRPHAQEKTTHLAPLAVEMTHMDRPLALAVMIPMAPLAAETIHMDRQPAQVEATHTVPWVVEMTLLAREGMDLAAGMRPLEVVDLMAVQVALGMTRPQVLEDIHLVAVATTTRMVEVRPQALVLQGRTTAMDPELVTRKAFRMEVVIKVDWTKTPMESDDATMITKCSVAHYARDMTHAISVDKGRSNWATSPV